MKKVYILLVITFSMPFLLCAQGNLEEYKKQENAKFDKFKKEYENDLKKMDRLFSAFINGERERYRVYSHLGYIPEKTKNKVENVERMYPKLTVTIPLKTSLKNLTVSERKWESQKTTLQNNNSSKTSTIDIPDELIPLDNEDELQVVDIVKNIEIKSVEEAALVKDELKAELEANRPVFSPLPKNSYRISSPFSKARKHPVLKIVRKHEGIDLAASSGTKVYATADGVVSISKYSRSAGKYIVINHQNTYSTSYMHLSKRFVKNGEKVKRGQVIGLVGNTGISTGNHLHYEVRKNGDAYDPDPFIENHF